MCSSYTQDSRGSRFFRRSYSLCVDRTCGWLLACNLAEGRTVQNLDANGDSQALYPSLGVASILPNGLLDQPASADPERRWPGPTWTASSQSEYQMQYVFLDTSS